MASSSTSSALASASTSTADGNNCYQFDVFLNHRGPDVKNTFVSHLYNRLRDHRLRVFLDREEIRKAEELTNEIDGAIRAASVHLAIFSPTYCESPWCLNELLLMLEMKQKKGSTILPIFFHVKPSALRWTEGEKGVYAEALSSLQKKKTFDSLQRYDSNTIGKWKNALKEVAGLSGFELDEAPYNRDEGMLLAAVVERLLKIVPKPPLDVSKYPTGLDDKIKVFEERVLLQQHQNGKARIVGIVGLGGVGKTTLAKELFNRERTKYPRSSFLCDVREKASTGSLESLQIQLIKDLSQVDVEINNTHEGISILKQHLSHCHALIIVDDADNIDQLDALLPAKDVLNCSSLILVTSRDKSVLTDWGVEDGFIYMLEGLNPQHSTELFCWHAFQKPHAVAGFEQLVNDFLDACKGLPLSLKVIGSLLYRKNLEYWKAQLRKISKILPEDIQKTLKISYDSLDEEEKQIFIDIACFLIGERKDRAIRIWDGSGWEGSLGLQNLENKCLVELKVEDVRSWEIPTKDKAECIRMHDHLRDLGRSLADKEHLRRIWRVTGNRSDPSPVQGIKNSAERDRLVTELQRPEGRGSYLESVFNVEQPPQPVMLRWYNYPYSASEFSTENLRILHVEGRDLEILWEHESEAPLELRELYITASRLSKIPDSIGQLKHLEMIVLRGDDSASRLPLKTLPDEFCQLLSLKHLKLSHCSFLRSLPDSFGNLTKLQHIELYCPNLLMLPNSFGNLIELKFLRLYGCHRLTISSETLGKITTLEYFYLSGRTLDIRKLPPQLAYQRFLQEMYLELYFKELPSDIGNLCNLKFLTLGSFCLEMLPPSFGHLRSLEELTFICCPLKCFPDSVRMLTQLKRLKIYRNKKVEKLEFKECPPREVTFQNVVEEVETVTDSRGRGVSSKMDASEASYFINAVFPNLQHLQIESCDRLVEVGALPTTLQSLEISHCEMLEELPNMQTLLSLEKLTTTGCPKLKRIHGLAQLTKLQRLDVSYCSELEELPGIEQSPSLKIVVHYSPKLQKLPREYEKLRI